MFRKILGLFTKSNKTTVAKLTAALKEHNKKNLLSFKALTEERAASTNLLEMLGKEESVQLIREIAKRDAQKAEILMKMRRSDYDIYTGALRESCYSVITAMPKEAIRHLTDFYALKQVEDIGIMEFLDASGANLLRQNKLGETLLFGIIDPDIARFLISLGNSSSFIHHTDKFQRKALHKVVCPEIAQILIDAGSIVDARDECQRTPLFYAATKKIAETLIKAGANVNHRDMNGRLPDERYTNDGVAEVIETERVRLQQIAMVKRNGK